MTISQALQLSHQKALVESLEQWRVFVSQNFQGLAWKDEEHMTDDIDGACMRAKYYRAKHFIFRPSLNAALHHQWSSISISRSQAQNLETPLASEHRSVEGLIAEIRDGVQTCISAATRNTTVWNLVPLSFLLKATDIFGRGNE